MKRLLIIAFYVASIDAYTQNESELLFDKASSFYYGIDLQDSANINFKENFDSSLVYLKILIQKYPNYRRVETLDRLSVCYFKRKEFPKSLDYALEVLSNFKTNNIEDSNYCLECNSACYRIGYIYQLQRKFEKALLYYDSCSTKYTTLPAFCSLSYYSEKIPQDHDLFICYQGLGQSKKALAELTPYLFDSTMNSYLDSVLINDYVKLISTLHSASEIKDNIQMAIDSMCYDVEVIKNQNDSKYNFKANCWLTLFNTKIFLIHDMSWSNDNNEIDSWLSKKSQIERVKNSVGYKRFFVP